MKNSNGPKGKAFNGDSAKDDDDANVDSRFLGEKPNFKDKMGATIGISNAAHLIEHLNASASAVQFLRELVKNSVEADAKRIEIGPSWAHLEACREEGHDPSWKFQIADDGKGMSRKDLLTYIANLSSSGREMGRAGNFGIGAKMSTLPWNRYGFIVMSWKGDEASMIRIIKRDDGQYAPMQFQTSEGLQDIVTPPDGYLMKGATSGTTVVLMGDSESDNTAWGPKIDGNEPGLFANYWHLVTRFFDFPEDVKLTVADLSTSDTPEVRGDVGQYRRMQGGRKPLDKYSKESGTIGTANAKIHWWYHPEFDPNGGTHSYMPPLGYVGVLFDGELYDVEYRGRKKSGIGKRLISLYGAFGVSDPEIMRHVTIIVEPQKFSDHTNVGAFAEVHRGGLVWSAGKNDVGKLPLNEWGDVFSENMPEVIQKALEAKWGKALDSNEVTDRMRLFFEALESFRPDNVSGEHTENNNQAPGRRSPPKPGREVDPAVDPNAKKRNKHLVPQDIWIDHPTKEQVEGLFKGKTMYASGLREGVGIVYYNAKDPYLVSITKRIQEHYKPSQAQQVKNEVRLVVHTMVCARILHLKHLRKFSEFWTRSEFDAAIEPAGLMSIILGYQDVENQVCHSMASRYAVSKIK